MHGGYAKAEKLLEVLKERGKAPGSLTLPVFVDALKREPGFVFMGSIFVALREANTFKWIQETVLSALLEAGEPLSLSMIISERPELAEFEEELEEIVKNLPFIVVMKDGRYLATGI